MDWEAIDAFKWSHNDTNHNPTNRLTFFGSLNDNQLKNIPNAKNHAVNIFQAIWTVTNLMFDVSVNFYWAFNGCKMQQSGVSSEKENLTRQEKNT